MRLTPKHIGKAGFLAAASLILVVLFSARSEVEQPSLHPEVAKAFARFLPSSHLLQIPLDEDVSALAWTNYLVSLDYDRSYFLQADLDRFEASRSSIGQHLTEGDTGFAFEVFQVFRSRLEDRYLFVTNQLARGFDFTIQETYEPRRQHSAWPADRQEQDDLWRRRIKNEFLGLKLSRELNATNGVENVTLETNGQPEGLNGGEADETTGLEPAEVIERRYAQFRTIIQDSDAEWVMQKYLSAVAGAFDPHSAYMSPATLEDFNIDMQLSLVGIGALLRPEDGTAKVVSLIPGGPADRDRREKALRPGDKIIGVGQDDDPIEDVLHLPLYLTVRKIRGEPGTRVVLRVISAADPSGATVRTVDLVREEVKLEEQAASSRQTRIPDADGRERSLGIVRLPAFYASMQTRDVNANGFRSATYDVSQALAELNAADVEGLLLDLRGNSGGSLREAIEMTGLFIRSGPVVQVREARAIHVLADRDPAVAFRRPMVVLVNRLSASASEILAGALQDYGRALIVGDSSTHGKGSVQTILPLGDNERLGSIKVTTASYYRINGGSTQLRGVVPDIVIPSLFDAMELGEKQLPNAMAWSQVAPAVYKPLADLSPLALELCTRSEQRRARDERFQQYGRLVDHLRELNARRSVPLEQEARKELIKAEHEIRRAESSLADGATDPADKESDPILDEALLILAELVQKQAPFEELNAPASEPLNDLMKRIFGL